VDIYDGFCKGIEDGFFDEANTTEQTGRQRLIAATDPFVHNGRLMREQQQALLKRLTYRRQQVRRQTGALKLESSADTRLGPSGDH
jgi:hypothetical protein